MLDMQQLRRDLAGVTARLQTRKNPQPFLDVESFSALEAERKAIQNCEKIGPLMLARVAKHAGLKPKDL